MLKQIGLLGLGNIGMGVYQILHNNKEHIKNSVGYDLCIQKVLIRNTSKKRDILTSEIQLTTNYEDIINDPNIAVVVELIGGIHPAYEYIKQAIISGKHVVTANKAVISHYGDELLALAYRHQVFFKFEGSVAGGIPIIAALTQSLAANKFTEITGILNGTTNYILTRMTKDGKTLSDALNMAKEKGYAEADSNSDIEGEDAAYKLSILSNIAFGIKVLPDKIDREGIKKISERDIEFASQLGYTIKLLAKARLCNEALEIHVRPALVPYDHPLSTVSDEFNALYVLGDAVGQLLFYGKGAGALPTSSAIMGDIMDIISKESMIIKNMTLKKDHPPVIIGENINEYYIRLQVMDIPGVLGKVTTILGKHQISLSSVVQRGKGNPIVPLILITHCISRVELNKALKEIEALHEVREIASILRVENF